MVSTEVARTVVGIIGNIICYFFYISPVPTFVKIWKKNSVEEFSPFPYLAALMSSLVWTLYSLPEVHPGSTLVLTVSASGVAIESVYVALFLVFADKAQRTRIGLVLLVELLITAFLGSLVLTGLVRSHENKSLIVGVICVFSSILMYSSPLAVMKLVIKTKSVEYMPFFLSFATFVNSLTWCIYAILRFDPFVMIPNGLGTMFGLIQLILHAMYYKSTTKKLMEARNAKEVNLLDVHGVSALESAEKIQTVS